MLYFFWSPRMGLFSVKIRGENVAINPTCNSLDNKGSCWILKDFYCSVTMLRELGLIIKKLSMKRSPDNQINARSNRQHTGETSKTMDINPSLQILGKNPQKSELIHRRQCLLSGATEPCIHVIPHNVTPRMACWHDSRPNSKKQNRMRVMTSADPRFKKIAGSYGIQCELVFKKTQNV